MAGAREWIGDLLAEDLAALRCEAGRLARQDSAGLHDFRVAARRLRSTLASFEPELPLDAARHLGGELRWLGQSVSASRDAEVIRERLLARIAEQPAELVIGPVTEAIWRASEAAHDNGAAAAAVVATPRYGRLVEELGGLSSALRKEASVEPIDEATEGPPRDDATASRDALRRDARRLRRQMRTADETSLPLRDAALHTVRKGAKRLRYGAESAAPLLGQPARRVARRARRIQDILGAHQDSVMARRQLLELAVDAAGRGDSGFTLGLLYAQEEASAAALRREYAGARRRLERAIARLDEGPPVGDSP